MPDNKTTRPSFSVLACPDSYLWKEELTRLLASFPPSVGTWEKKVFWGDEEPTENFWRLFTATALLGTSHAVIVHNAEAWNAKHWANIDTMIFRLSPFCWPIFCLEVPWTSGKPKIPAYIAKTKCLEIAEKKGWIWKQEGLTERTIRAHLAQRAKDYPNIPKAALDELSLTTILDARGIENELNKLSLYYESKRKLNASDWKVEREKECNYFSCIQHIMNGNLKTTVLELFQDHDTEKVFFILLAMLDRHFRTLWEIKTGQSTLQGPSRSYKNQEARAVSLPILARGMGILVDAEASVKQGDASIPQALDTLLIQITDLFAKKSSTYA